MPMSQGDEFLQPAGFEEDEIPVISDAMLHPDVDFEAGMSPVPPVCLALMAACVLGFVAEASRGALADVGKLRALGALSRPEVEAGQVWRLVSPIFLHGGFDHLFGNMVALYILGMACEHGFGRPQFLTLFVAAGVGGSLLSLWGGRVSVGASGAIFGLIGAMVTMLWRHRGRLHLRDRRIGGVLFLWAIYQFFLGALSPGIDNLAHFGGFVTGALLGLVLRPAVLVGKAEVASQPLAQAGLAATVAALIGTAIFFVPRLVG
jgi:rhomboid protease GluP